MHGQRKCTDAHRVHDDLHNSCLLVVELIRGTILLFSLLQFVVTLDTVLGLDRVLLGFLQELQAGRPVWGCGVAQLPAAPAIAPSCIMAAAKPQMQTAGGQESFLVHSSPRHRRRAHIL